MATPRPAAAEAALVVNVVASSAAGSTSSVGEHGAPQHHLACGIVLTATFA
jgi:hypothetical protein